MFDFSPPVRFSLSAALAALALLLMPSAASAVTYTGNAFANGGTTSVPASYSDDTYMASALSTTTGLAGGSAYAYGVSLSPGDTYAEAEVDYVFQIHGPASPFAVPLSIKASGSVIGSGLVYSSFIEFGVDLGGITSPGGVYFGRFDDKVFADNNYHPGGSVYGYDNVLMAPVDSDIYVKLIAYVSVGGCCGAEGTLSTSTAFLDPLFTLVGDPAGYSIVGVPGLDDAGPGPTPPGPGTGGTVPEPASPTLLAAGAVAWVARRRQRVAGVATSRAVHADLRDRVPAPA